MECRVLGSLEVRIDGRSVALGSPKQRAVLAVELLHIGGTASIGELIERARPDRLLEVRAAAGARDPRTRLGYGSWAETPT